MKTLNQYILEKFKISKDIKETFTPDDMPGKEVFLYSDEPDEEGESQADSDYLQKVLDKIDSKYKGFIAFRNGITIKGQVDDETLSKNFVSINIDLNTVYSKIVTGNDLGYEIKLSKGRIQIDALNSGSRAIFYIYALTKTGYETFMDWVDNVINDEKIFFDEKNFEQIEDTMGVL